MALSVEQFVANLSQTGLLSAAEVSTFFGRMPAAERPTDAEALAALLVDQGKLTQYQAQAISAGQHQNLVFGEYVVLDKLGAGGMGVVLKARHRRMDRLVAIKVLPAESLKSPAAVERFYREVKAAARLLHPNIVAAFDAGEHGGMHYLVMEYVDGRDLSQIVAERGPLPVAQAVECIAQAAKGLEFAHAMGIVHRDIKPSNLLLSKDGQVKILDMGLALLGEATAADVTTAAQLTHSGQVMGTIDYMSPEQAQDTHRADARSDIYSLGCTLWRLLIGEPVYVGDSLMNRMLAHQQSPIPSLRDRRADVPETLDGVFRKMIAKRPEDRFQTAAQVIHALLASLVADAPTWHIAEESSSGGSLGLLAEQQGSRTLAARPGTTTAADDTLSRQVEDTNPRAATANRGGAPQAGKATGATRRPLRWAIAAGIAVTVLALAAWIFLHSRDIARIGVPPGGSVDVVSPELTAGSRPGQEWSGNGPAMKFCWCPAGEFKMGEGIDAVDVNLTRGFWLGKHEVTQAEYRAVMKSSPSGFSITGPGQGQVEGLNTDKFPVEQVTWAEAAEFCRALTRQEQTEGRLPAGWEYRLPSEAQWEYACRAGTQMAFSFEGDESRLKDYAWYRDNSGKRPHEVGQKPANRWGLHDMHGNVREWCQDAYQETLTAGSDPIVEREAANRVIRGGCWQTDDNACRLAHRMGIARDSQCDNVGFRVALVQVSPSTAVAPLKVGQTAGEDWSDNSLGMRFCWCPPGEFKMGEGNGVPVTLTRGFYLGKYEVTQAEYRAVTNKSPSHFSATGPGKDAVAGLKTDEFPVENVSWEEATEYCRLLTDRERKDGRVPADWEFRLPTEAQWEYACRAGSQKAYTFGDAVDELAHHAWYEANSDKRRPHEVGQKKSNAWGLRDMHGNVVEWCRDWQTANLPGGADPDVADSGGADAKSAQPAKYRVYRGGSSISPPAGCRSGYCSGNTPQSRGSGMGFRVALVQTSPSAKPKSVVQGAKPGEEWSANGLAMKFCWCPPGELRMGEAPDQVDVRLTRGFWLGKFEVTQTEYQAVMKANPSHFSPASSGRDSAAGLNTASFPVESITWAQAAEFCQTLTQQELQAGRLPKGWEYRLPTEAQWEYACRAGTASAYGFGDTDAQLEFHAWYHKNSEKRTHEVGQLRSNEWGLHDMHGNVWEWCRDWHQQRLPGGTDPEVVKEGAMRVLRGGSWDDLNKNCRAGMRFMFDPAYGVRQFGFRVAIVQVNTPPAARAPMVGARPGEEWSENGLAMKLCWCPDGKFTMGSPREEANRGEDEDQVPVTLTRGFWLGKYEVTQKEYVRIVAKNPSCYAKTGGGSEAVEGVDTDSFPVEFVSWAEATAFCRKLTEQERKAGRLTNGWEYRLPTEAEWEYACRAGTKTATAFGDKLASRQANFDGRAPYNVIGGGAFRGLTCKVGTYPGNDWGLCDMCGNVLEWCRDSYRATLPGGTDPEVTEEIGSHVLRGGSWASHGQDCRSAHRHKHPPDYRDQYVGFRVALARVAPAVGAKEKQ